MFRSFSSGCPIVLDRLLDKVGASSVFSVMLDKSTDVSYVGSCGGETEHQFGASLPQGWDGVGTCSTTSARELNRHGAGSHPLLQEREG